MKKYIITTLLGIIGMTAFTSAGYTSESEINSYTFTNEEYISSSNFNNKYLCIETNNIPYYVSITNIADDDLISVSQKVYCINEKTSMPTTISFAEDENWNNKQISGKIYYSNSIITYTEDTTSGGGTNDNNGNIIAGGVNDFSGIITKLGAIAGEFIPYMIFGGLGILAIVLSIQAVKSILNNMKRQSYNTMIERREKRYYQRYRNKKRRDLLEYAKHGYNVKNERESSGFGRRHG